MNLLTSSLKPTIHSKLWVGFFFSHQKRGRGEHFRFDPSEKSISDLLAQEEASCMFVIASAHKVTNLFGDGKWVEMGGGEWDNFLLQLEPGFFGLKAANSDFSWSQKFGVIEGGPPPFSRTRNGGYSCEFGARSIYLRTLTLSWVVPPPSNSHHQDYYIFSRGSL